MGVLLVIGAIWGMPHAGPSSPVAASARAAIATAAATASAAPQLALATPAAAPLPVAGSVAFQQVPVPPAQRPGHHVTPKAVAPAPAPAAPSGGWGNDISWPQCDRSYPGAHDVGTVGVTDGRPFTVNPCLASQFGWAKASKYAGGAQGYINLEIGGLQVGPKACVGDDHPCRAYNYGYMSAYDAMIHAMEQGVRPDFWWLDVEVGNWWSDTNLDWNANVVQGAIDAVTARGNAVGIYSSVDQWWQIIGDAYRPNVATWLAVVGDAGMAPSLCSQQHSLTKGPVLVVQYDDHGFDSDYICAAGVKAFAAAGARNHR
jgi:hypothetical protein